MTTKASGALLVRCQLALGLTQKEIGELLGKHRRTVQRWQKGGVDLLPDQAEKLADALRLVRPDLAEGVLEMGRKTAILAGMAPPRSRATAQVIDAILQAAADAAGTSPEAIRSSVTAAFLKAQEEGVEVSAIVAGLGAAGEAKSV
jgi:transcriptional regulator with XRE-family HTH domain